MVLAKRRRSRQIRWLLLLLAGLVVWTILALSIDNGIFGVFQDDGLYLSAARSLRDGQGFGVPGRPGAPPPKYPIGLPALLAVALRLDPRPPSLDHEVAIARGLVVLGGWGFFLGAHGWLRRLGVGPALACWIVLATAFHHVVLIGGAATLFADLPFAAVTYALLARFVGRRRGNGANPSGWGRGLLDGVLAGYGFLLRTNGITLIAASLVASALGRSGKLGLRWRPFLGCLVGVALVVVPLTWYAGLHPRVVPSNSYLLELKAGWASPGAGVRLVARNLASVVGEFPTRVLASPTTYVDAIHRGSERLPAVAGLVRAGFSLVVALGLIRLIRASRRRDWPAWTHALGSVAIFAVWPWNGILDRFLMSLFPMVLLAFARGVDALIGLVPGVGARRAARERWVGLVLALVVVGNGAVVLRSVQFFHAHAGQWPGAPDRVDQALALSLIRERTEPDAVIASAWPEMVALQTGRTSVPIFEDEAILTDRYGDVTRLNLWLDQVRGRPVYFLHRSPEADSKRADEAQIAALTAPGSGLAIRLVSSTPNEQYRISRLVAAPGR